MAVKLSSEPAVISRLVTGLPSLTQVALVFPNNDPVAFMVAFYGCLLAEVVPVPIEVPLSRKVLHESPIVPLTCPAP